MTRDPKGVAAKAGRILVVEDSPSARRLMQDVLLRLGAELPNIRVAGTVFDALTLFSQWRPEVVFVDVQLRSSPPTPLPSDAPAPSDHDPTDGAELAVLFLKRNPRVRIILCSATDPSDPRVSGLVTDRKVDFIMKPLLASRVEEVLSRSPGRDSPARASKPGWSPS
jgi:CheY-like chemotaxis protein